jgi:hypothetical protein
LRTLLGCQRFGQDSIGSRKRRPFQLRLERLEDRVVPSLVINPTFDASITNDPNAAAIEATINRTIAAYESLIADNVTVNITFKEKNTGLGGSNFFFFFENYSDYRSALVSHATSANDNTAIASLPNQSTDPINDQATVRVGAPLARALGFNAPTSTDGTISLNTSICNLDRTSVQDPNKYDLQAVTAHEIDEILGFGSTLDAANNGDPAPTGRVSTDDLFRYDQNGNRSYTTSATAQAYFSIDGGQTDLARFNQTHTTQNAGDYGDWYSFFGGQTPQVQDAFNTPGAKANLGVEMTRLDVNGYTLNPLNAPAVTAAANQTAVEGAAKAIDLGSFSDPNAAPWGVTVSWGDGSPNTTFYLNNPGALGTKTHSYGEEGNYTVTVTVTDFTNQSSSETFKVNVSDPAVVATPVPVSAVEGKPFTNTAIATFTDPGGPEPNTSAHYKVASINWGDGTPLDMASGVISLAGSTFTVKGSHTYGEEGAYTITAIIDHEGVLTTVQSKATVSDPAVVATGVPVVAVECRTLTVPVATFTDPGGAEPNPSDPSGGVSDHYAASINWGDSTPASTATIAFAGGIFTVSGSHAYASEGTYTITTTINHEGIITTTTSKATIKDDLGLLLLDPTGSKSLMVTGNGIVDVTGCGAAVVDSNDNQAAFLSGHGTVTAQDIDVTGGVKTAGHADFSGPVDQEAATPDPLGLTLPAPPSSTFAAVHYSGSAPLTLQPGTYLGGIAITGRGPVTLAPGVYYLQGGGFSVSGQGSVSGTGVTIISAPAGPGDAITFSGQGNVALTAPTSGPFQGIVLFQDPASSNAIRFTGQAAVTLSGVVYVPSALVSIDGNANVTINAGPGTAAPPPILGALIAYDLKVDGNGVLTINPDDPPGDSWMTASNAAALSSAGTAAIPSAALDAPPSGGGSQGDDDLLTQTAILLSRDQQAVGNNPSPSASTQVGTSASAANRTALDQLFSGSTGALGKGAKSLYEAVLSPEL